MQINSDYIVVDTIRSLQLVLITLSQADSISIDTESSGYYTYFSKVCLIQISAKGKNYIIDPLKLQNLDGLGNLFEDKKILKIFHSAIDDIKALKKDFGFKFHNIADTGFSSRLLDHEQYSLTYLVDYYHKIKLSKKEQKSNWEKRPLEKSQLQYAALDTVYLETIWEKMKEELTKRNLYEEALSEFEKIASEEPGAEGNSISMDKFPEILEYSADERRFIYDTLVFRDDKSRKLNKAPFRVFNNEKVILLVKSRRDMAKLTEIVGKKDAESLFRIYANPSGPPIQKSELFKKPGENLTNEEGERFKRLRIWRETIMSIRRMSHQMMPSNKMIAELAQRNPKTLDELREMNLFSEWKVIHYGPSILAALENVPYESNIKGLIPINKKFE
ncbi:MULTISPECIES: ribonuclease D [Leptospira]|uniref:3'-5' exonuclease n=4 Tax=Leptospira borgpetersenii TaxID=174 RepID=M3HP94_LEPBO|nr:MULTISPECIES: ribonuclease D [Leptospira]EMF99469.1 3'-5' exonuclease [Leptospira borgpetersenii str. 200701203]EMO08239.1 3'-5' exonuclease [Leptospira borgpetersenii str. Noumea 25]ANG99731.1 3'-5' exonuclease [Leptospira borgpetersenii str. 4E]AXX14353.1 ribonuclease D [Leptospira borgpetersenii serovar Ceylonica]EKQ92007.1 3'-5' exonuclease [Leptospira borgpetersenii str. UI 09149]